MSRTWTVRSSLLCITLLATIATANAAQKRIVVQGRVLLDSGQGLAGWPVIMIATQRYVEFSKYTSGGKVDAVATTRTDRNGYFTFDVPRKRGYHYWFLRFIEPESFDSVKYILPDDIEITALARRGRLVEVGKTISYHPDWPEVERLISEAGGRHTAKGEILSAIGLPEKRADNSVSGEEEWWYFTKGIVYMFRDNEPTGLRRFEPVKRPAG